MNILKYGLIFASLMSAGCSALLSDQNETILNEWKYIEPHFDPYMIKGLRSMSIKPLFENEIPVDDVALRLVVSSSWGAKSFTLNWKPKSKAPNNAGDILIEWVDIDTGELHKKKRSLSYSQIQEIEMQLRLIKQSMWTSLPARSKDASETVTVDDGLILIELVKDGKYHCSLRAEQALDKESVLKNILAMVAKIAHPTSF